MLTKKDLVGQRFGELVVLEHQPNRRVLCRCDCGKEKSVLECHIKSGATKSCGCLLKKLNRERYKKDLVGQQFGKLIVLKEVAPNPSGGIKYLCLCDCGNERITSSNALLMGRVDSCGCIPNIHKNLYQCWADIKQRCTNPNVKNYRWYGAKGISVCEVWNEFKPFKLWALSSGYKVGLTIDRIDPRKNYEPNNCRWITKSENSIYAGECRRNLKIGKLDDYLYRCRNSMG